MVLTEQLAKKRISKAKYVLVALAVSVMWMAVLVGGALFGWWHRPIAPRDDASAFMRAATEIIDRENRGNAALILIESGEIVAEHYAGKGDAINGDTVFETASLSKWIAAWGVMKLAEEGKLDLDRPVEDYLKRWRLPPSEFDNRRVTARRLLSHTAGFTDGLGFGEYEANESIPSLEDSLANPRASSGKPVRIAVGAEPGSGWRYSGGSYLLLELLVEEVSGEPFDAFMQTRIFAPLAMTHSSYRHLGEVENSANSYDREGKRAASYRYASRAATGLTTSAGDLAKFAQAQLSSMKEKPLSQETIDSMRKPHAKESGIEIWGLGTMLYAPTKTGNVVFGHDGANEPAVNSSVRVNPDSGDAIVVLVTGGKPLASQIGAEWVYWQTGLPDFLTIPAALMRLVPFLIGGPLLIIAVAFFIARRRARAL